MKFTKKHNRVARKNLLKVRKAKEAGATGSANKAIKRGPARQTEVKKSSWSLSSLLKNVTAYFTGETTKTVAKKRVKRVHPIKKSTKASAAAAPAKTAAAAPAKPTVAAPAKATTAAKK